MLTEEISAKLPTKAIDEIAILLEKHPFVLKIKRSRKSKYGDFRVKYDEFRTRSYEISVNEDLQPTHFLLTLIHEIAHLLTYKKFEKSVRPHGREWQQHFRYLMQPFLEIGIYDKKTREVLETYLLKPAKANEVEYDLIKMLEGVDTKGLVKLETILNKDFFELEGKQFQRLEKIRTRYICKNLGNNKLYYIASHARVLHLK